MPRDWISSEYPYKTIMTKGTTGNANGLLEYVAEAEPATLTSSTGWRISKLVYDSSGFNTQILWADGNRYFDKIADDYSTYTYTA